MHNRIIIYTALFLLHKIIVNSVHNKISLAHVHIALKQTNKENRL